MDILKDQLDFVPKAEGEPSRSSVYVCGGMGGSALPALAARMLGAKSYIVMHRDYGLPSMLPAGASCIALSYSGNTEETLSFANAALQQGLPLSVIASGGELLALAKEHSLPYVQVPAGLVPRDAVLYTTKALLACIGESALVEALSSENFDAETTEHLAEDLAATLQDTVPVFYSSLANEALSYIAKIECNETAKVPAFSNVFPELNHNEMQSFDGGDGARSLTSALTAVFLEDTADNSRIQRRMALTKQLLEEKGVRTASIELPQGSRAQTFLYGWWMVRMTARALAAKYCVESDATPLIESFKKNL